MCEGFLNPSKIVSYLFTLIAMSVLDSAFSATARLPLEDISFLAPDDAVKSFTLPAPVAEHLRAKLMHSSRHKAIRISEKPWGSQRPGCFCQQLMVWDAFQKHSRLVVVEPMLGTKDLFGKDAWSLTWAVLEMSTHQTSEDTVIKAVPFKEVSVLDPDASIAQLKLPLGVAAQLEDLVEGSLRVSEEPWGAVRPRCLCRNLAIWDPSGIHKQILVVEPDLESKTLNRDDAKHFQDAVIKMAGHSRETKNAKIEDVQKFV
mmetsp:Transcript_158266/g.303707  ORF Transcript_158266/g.303707 Transcript_158266/m.303707 type:complete len:259 (+) Transcript_158266:75-851(+)